MSEQSPPEEAIVEPRPKLSIVLLSRGRLSLMLGVFIVELALFLAGLLTPLDQATQLNLVNETNKSIGLAQNSGPLQIVALIFGHNIVIALAEAVPILGASLFVFSIYSTGLATQAIVSSKGLPGAFGVVLFFYPYSMVELAAYAIAVGSGVMLLVAWRKKRLGRELRVFLLEAVIVAATLLVAAAMEAATIVSPVLGFFLWVPAGLAAAGLIIAARRQFS